jgi:hypothetical protein
MCGARHQYIIDHTEIVVFIVRTSITVIVSVSWGTQNRSVSLSFLSAATPFDACGNCNSPARSKRRTATPKALETVRSSLLRTGRGAPGIRAGRYAIYRDDVCPLEWRIFSSNVTLRLHLVRFLFTS